MYRSRDADEYNAFWAEIVESPIYANMTEDQVDAVKSTVDFFVWASQHEDVVSPRWDELREFIDLGAVGAVYADLPGEDMLPNIRIWAVSHWPVRGFFMHLDKAI